MAMKISIAVFWVVTSCDLSKDRERGVWLSYCPRIPNVEVCVVLPTHRDCLSEI